MYRLTLLLAFVILASLSFYLFWFNFKLQGTDLVETVEPMDLLRGEIPPAIQERRRSVEVKHYVTEIKVRRFMIYNTFLGY